MTAPPDEEQFTAAALRRIYVGTAALGVAGTLGLLLWKGWWLGLGFAAGAALSYLNFHWLKGGVDTLAGYATQSAQAPARPRRVAAKFVARYALIGLIGYFVFRTSWVSLMAFLAGLFVFVAAVLAEMVYELAQGVPGA